MKILLLIACAACAVGCSRVPPVTAKKSVSVQEQRSRDAAMRAIDIQNQEACLRNDLLLLKHLMLERDIARLQGSTFKKSGNLKIVRELVAEDQSALETARDTDRMIGSLEKANGTNEANEDIPGTEKKLFSNLLAIHDQYREKMRALIQAPISPSAAR